MKPYSLLLCAVALTGLLAAACGDDGDPSTSSSGAERSVEIDMVDNRFEPARIDAAAGETVRFVFSNTGDVDHDAFIGDEAAQRDHGMEMASDQGGHGATNENALTVMPGESGELTYTFPEAGEVIIGCHQPGHYEAGMRVTVEVA